MRTPPVPALALVAALVLAAACSSTDKAEQPDVSVTAVADAEGTRILFQLNDGDVSDRDVHVEAATGKIRDFCRSPDLRRVSVLWSNSDGTLTCTFPYGQKGEWSAGDAKLDDQFLYVFHDSEYGRVTTRVPRGAPMRPRLLVHVEVPSDQLPARLRWNSGEPRELVRESSMILIELPTGKNHILRSGDWKMSLETGRGRADFHIGVDDDGTPSATNGHVERAP